MRKYDDEFKREAVRKVLDGQSVASVARELGVSTAQLHAWKKQKLEVATDVEREMIELKRRLREVEMERDILKKAALIFGRHG
ncbi:MAG: transposase [Blastocatellia bacterium]|nr:transposase [Blastocatellia bacterium]